MAITASQKHLLLVIATSRDEQGMARWSAIGEAHGITDATDLWALRDAGLVTHGPETGVIKLTDAGRREARQ